MLSKLQYEQDETEPIVGPQNFRQSTVDPPQYIQPHCYDKL